MARAASEYVCNQCGNVTTKWSGKCESCEQWNTISEIAGSSAPPVGRGAKKAKGKSVELAPLAGDDKEPEQRKSGIGEFDRVLGGGLVPGSATLIGGDPGIGKSTLLLQAAAAVSKQGGKVIYVSGEEALAQLRMRASRLGLADADVQLASETNVADIIKTLEKQGDLALVVIDSIQTMWSPAIEAAPGTVSQVRVASQELIHFAKNSDAPGAGRPCHQRRTNCRPACARTYGRYGGLF